MPALAPPPGVVPNFVDPVSRADAVTTANGVVTAVMLFFVFALSQGHSLDGKTVSSSIPLLAILTYYIDSLLCYRGCQCSLELFREPPNLK